MKRIPMLSFLAPLVAAALLAGCGSVGIGDPYPGRYPDRYPDRDPNGAYGRYDDRAGDLRGTVASVNTRERLIYIDQEGDGYRNGLRNGDGAGETAVFSYDDGTVVRYQGQTFRPQDLERGDRIQASVERSGNRLFAQQIDVLYDVSTGGRYEGGGQVDQDTDRAADLRGTVRSIDLRYRTLELEPSRYGRRGFSSDGRADVVVVQYDRDTTVRYQGRAYSPENIERGDEVEIQAARDRDGRLLAQEIVVVGEGQPSGR